MLTRLRVVELHSVAELAAAAPAWSDLLRRDPLATPFQGPEWLLAYCRAFGVLQPWGVGAWRGQRLASLAVLVVYRDAGRRIATLLGAGRSDWLDAIVDPELSPDGAAPLLERIAARRDAFDALLLERLPARGWLARARLPAPLVATEEEDEPCPALELPGSVGELRRRLAAHLVENIEYGRRRLARLGAVEIVSAGPDGVDRHLSALFALHAARWSLRGAPGVLRERPVRRFHAEATRALSASGLLRGYRLTVSGRAAAAWHGFELNRRLYYYLGGFDPAFRAASPGAVLLAHAAEEGIRAGAGSLDLLRGREPYKYAWGALDQPALRRMLRPADLATLPSRRTAAGDLRHES
jgi:CelD/BcsL family acetyltransferase involved in cellulose biosynthesis